MIHRSARPFSWVLVVGVPLACGSGCLDPSPDPWPLAPVEGAPATAAADPPAAPVAPPNSAAEPMLGESDSLPEDLAPREPPTSSVVEDPGGGTDPLPDAARSDAGGQGMDAGAFSIDAGAPEAGAQDGGGDP